jgi:hypothetical protein
MKQLILKNVPKGSLVKSDFEVNEAEIPTIKEGEVLIKNILLSIDAANRAWMQGKTYRDAVRAGDIMPTYSISEVVESNDNRFKPGQIVSGDSLWSEYAATNGKLLYPCPNIKPLSNLLSFFGIAGLTAYHGLTKIGKIKSGETVVVSAAGGSVGLFVGQIAKAMGCRVVGIAGNDEKCRNVVNDLNFDACINYKNGTLIKDLKIECPNGIDVYFDNVGGSILETVLFRMNNKGRIICCGAVSQYDGSSPTGPRNLPGLVVTKRLKMEGFVVMDFAREHGEAIKHMSSMMADGKIKIVEDITDGLENAPDALINLLAGENYGKCMVRVAPDPV